MTEKILFFAVRCGSSLCNWQNEMSVIKYVLTLRYHGNLHVYVPLERKYVIISKK